MALFSFAKKNEKTKSFSCGCATSEATEVVNTCCGEAVNGICCSDGEKAWEIQNHSNGSENGHGHCDPAHWTVYVLACIIN